ncbi:DeoR/GlpR family DNA-binding transcription regulator [Leekyejoonella antrihumi]|uniref:DeoR/GlpR transcriptional regulator n=1 Tax=Leekyejoonella antrihumi TaxID=1660198 RepID=A0A563DVY0_9MICO|nr:DeoR/GlpR family DNA-binding transcription regulator [Leekyejoonella antrihumi]TWP34102.1 DeoR/GlpR transcriptional regulator [Leekyejoonella antrihumi]
MLRHERLSALLELVATQGSVSVDDIVQEFQISAATVRRDLNDLASQQFISRTRGGAVAHAVTYDLPLRYKRDRRTEQKRRIAEGVADLVTPDSVVALNGGTTMTEVARSLATRTEGGHEVAPLTSLTVVTNALNIANELAVRPNLKVVVIGGVLRPQSFELIGPFAQAVLEGVTLDVMLLGVDAVSATHGAAATHEGEALINGVMVERARRVVVVADSSKLGQRAFCTICAAGSIDELVTDADADPAVVEQFEALGVDVRLA